MTLEDAKKAFMKYDGSLFAMAREEKETYESYQLLNIPDEMADKWRQELFLDVWEQLKENGSSALFHRMYHLSESRHDKENLFILRDALHKVNYQTPKENASIAETVLGRKALSERSGMVFWAYDLDEHELAEELLQLVMELVAVPTSDEKIRERLERVRKKCDQIRAELKLSTVDV